MRLLAAFLVALVLASVASAASPVRSFVRSAGPVDARRTIVLVNGGPGYDSQQIFRAFKRLASPTRRVIAYDQRGIGRTPPPSSVPHDYSLDAFVADLEALRIRLGVQRIDLLGHSFGALVASAYTAAHPNRVRSLILHSGLPMSVGGAVRGRREIRAATWLAAAPGRRPRIHAGALCRAQPRAAARLPR